MTDPHRWPAHLARALVLTAGLVVLVFWFNPVR